MAHIIDSYMENTRQFDGKWYFAKPLPDTRGRLKDSLGVLLGKYTAVYFKEDSYYKGKK